MILLFDVDGVLVEQIAYHVGLQRTVHRFATRLGLVEAHTLNQTDIEEFEAQAITTEWESGAISVASLLTERVRVNPPAHLPTQLDEALAHLALTPTHIARPDFASLARRVGTATPPGTLPAHTALAQLKAEWADSPLCHMLEPLWHALLHNCYDIDHAPVMRIVQHFAVGDEHYQTSYNLPSLFPSESLLATLDKPFLSPRWRDHLLMARAIRQAFPVLYTARPSLPPREVTYSLRGFTPEAEIAQRLVGLVDIPVVGFGRVDWLAGQVGELGQNLVKPSPVQALAAMGAAMHGQERAALFAAHILATQNKLYPPLADVAGHAVHVFEDSASSLRAVTRAVAMLNAHGLEVTLTRHGIAPAHSSKRTALNTIADFVHPSINDALQHVLGN